MLTTLDAKRKLREPLPAEADAMLDRTAMLGDRREEALLEALRARTELVEIPKDLDAEGRSRGVALNRLTVDNCAPPTSGGLRGRALLRIRRLHRAR